MRAAMWLLLLISALACAVPTASGQGAPSGMIPGGMPAPAPPETLVVWLAAADSSAACTLRPGTDAIRFGAPWRLEVIPQDGATAPDSLTVSVPWFSLRREADPEVSGAFVARVTRTGPFRLGWERDPATLGDVMIVEGRLAPGEGPDPVRSPWRLDRRRWPLIVAVLLAVAAMTLLWWLRRRREADEIERITAPTPDPAWAGFMVDAAALADAGLPDGPGARLVLDRLDRILRSYLRSRYGIDATALAPGEVDRALVDRSYPAGSGAAFDVLLGDLDIWRYAPASESPLGLTRRLLEAAVRAVEATSEDRNAVGSAASAGVAGEAARRKLHGMFAAGGAS